MGDYRLDKSSGEGAGRRELVHNGGQGAGRRGENGAGRVGWDLLCHYVPSIRYSYSAGGREAEGSRIRFGMVTSRSEAGAKQILDPFRVGSSVAVRYDPANVEESVLQETIVSPMPLIMSVLCLGLTFLGFWILPMVSSGMLQ